MRKEDGRKDSENSWVEFNTPTRDGRRIVEGCALVPPRQFIRTLGSYFAALVLGRLGGSWEGSGTLLGEAWAPLG